MLTNLKKLRDETAISQKALADAIGVSQQSINKYENHNIEPDIETMVRMADYFNTSVDYLIGHTDVRCQIGGIQLSELSADEVYLVRRYRSLDKRQKFCINTLIDSYSD